MRQPSDEGVMGWWREDGREDDRRRHDDDEERGNEQAAEVSLDRRHHAAHGIEDSKARRTETSGLGPRPAQAGCRSDRRVVAVAASALRLRTYSCTRETTVAWLHVSGETETGALL